MASRSYNQNDTEMVPLKYIYNHIYYDRTHYIFIMCGGANNETNLHNFSQDWGNHLKFGMYILQSMNNICSMFKVVVI